MGNQYFGDWDGYDAMIKDFGYIRRPTIPSPEAILFAAYSYEDCSGDAVVIFTRDGKLYEVRGIHCSYSGLEEQWEPSEVTWKALAMRRASGFLDSQPVEAHDYFWNLVDRHLEAN